MGLRGLLRRWFTFLYVDDIRTSQETQLRASSACHGESFIFGNQMIFVPHRKYTLGLPRPVTWTPLLFHLIYAWAFLAIPSISCFLRHPMYFHFSRVL
jgi:hypothetical protein